MVRRALMVQRSLWDAAIEKSTFFNISDTIRIFLRAHVAGIVDVYELAKKLDELDELEKTKKD